jgi:hypothetical protein
MQDVVELVYKLSRFVMWDQAAAVCDREGMFWKLT